MKCEIVTGNMPQLWEDLLSQLHEKEYPSESIRHYREAMGRVDRYMRENQILEYTEAVGETYLATHGGRISSGRQFYMSFYVRRLNDILNKRPNVEREETDPLLVQIIHSEFDADGIDYLMRDATFSGTSFGSFEIDQLIRCLTVGEFENKKILCIKPKGIAAADQYLINKFFSYSQVVFNKHIVISEWMAEYVIDWMQKHHAIFPNGKTLESWAKGSGQSEEYLNFTDNMFWAALSRILYDDLSDLVPHHIKTFCTYLLRHMEPDFLDEKRIITSDEAEAKSLLKSSEIVKNEAVRCQRIAILSKKRMTNQMPIEKFRALLQERNCEHEEATPADISYLPSPEASRLMECFSVKEADGSIHLLCDDDRSLMRQMYACTLVILREYQFPKDEA